MCIAQVYSLKKMCIHLFLNIHKNDTIHQSVIMSSFKKQKIEIFPLTEYEFELYNGNLPSPEEMIKYLHEQDAKERKQKQFLEKIMQVHTHTH